MGLHRKDGVMALQHGLRAKEEGVYQLGIGLGSGLDIERVFWEAMYFINEEGKPEPVCEGVGIP